MKKYTGIELIGDAPVGTSIIRLALPMVAAMLLFFLPLIFLLNYFFGFNGFRWAQPAADILTTGIAVILSHPVFRLMRGNYVI